MQKEVILGKLILHASEAAWFPIHPGLPDGESSATTTCVICHQSETLSTATNPI